jgi:hypothetical protein
MVSLASNEFELLLFAKDKAIPVPRSQVQESGVRNQESEGRFKESESADGTPDR